MNTSNLSYSYIELTKLLGNEKTNTRSDIWLWLHLTLQEEANLDPDSCNGLTMRSEIISYLRKSNYLPHQINADKDRYLLPDSVLNWITEDERQCHWLEKRLLARDNSRLTSRLVHLRGKNLIIANIDIWDIDLSTKEVEIKKLRIDWFRHIAKDINFEWFTDKKEGNRRCECAREWLEKNKHTKFTQLPIISNYNELLMHFDNEYPDTIVQKTIIGKIKKQWNKKQFDERTPEKGQYNFRLEKLVVAQLDTLAKKQGIKRAQILETLITREYEASEGSTDNI